MFISTEQIAQSELLLTKNIIRNFQKFGTTFEFRQNSLQPPKIMSLAVLTFKNAYSLRN